MKARYLFYLALTLVGCSTTAPNHGTLTTAQATCLAQKLANEKAQSLYHGEPFRNGPQAQFIHGRWAWHAQEGWGKADIEATVSFAADGANPSVIVTPLYSSPRFSKSYR